VELRLKSLLFWRAIVLATIVSASNAHAQTPFLAAGDKFIACDKFYAALGEPLEKSLLSDDELRLVRNLYADPSIDEATATRLAFEKVFEARLKLLPDAIAQKVREIWKGRKVQPKPSVIDGSFNSEDNILEMAMGRKYETGPILFLQGLHELEHTVQTIMRDLEKLPRLNKENFNAFELRELHALNERGAMLIEPQYLQTLPLWKIKAMRSTVENDQQLDVGSKRIFLQIFKAAEHRKVGMPYVEHQWDHGRYTPAEWDPKQHIQNPSKTKRDAITMGGSVVLGILGTGGYIAYHQVQVGTCERARKAKDFVATPAYLERCRGFLPEQPNLSRTPPPRSSSP
jgi:hypothetical protein